MIQILALLVAVGVPLTALLVIARLSRSRKNEPTLTGNGSNSAFSAIASVFRHPFKAAIGLLAQLVGTVRRGLSRLEVRLNLAVVSEAVQEKRDQIRTIEKLLANIGDIGLKVTTIEALRAKAGETLTSADGLEAVSADFNAQLQTFLSKEAQLNTLKYLAAQVASMNLADDASQDINDRLREAINSVELERVKLAQAVEFVAIKASHS